jgi:hypothetical protein
MERLGSIEAALYLIVTCNILANAIQETSLDKLARHVFVQLGLNSIIGLVRQPINLCKSSQI